MKMKDTYFELNIWVKPKATKQGFLGLRHEGLILGVHAIPKDGEANQAILDYLSKYFKVPKSCIELIRGQKSRTKTFKIELNTFNQICIKTLIAGLTHD
jgi:hypothetical protein